MSFSISGSGHIVVAVSESIDSSDLSAAEAQFAADAAAAQASISATEQGIVDGLKALVAQYPAITSLSFGGQTTSVDIVAAVASDAAAASAPAETIAAETAPESVPGDGPVTLDPPSAA